LATVPCLLPWPLPHSPPPSPNKPPSMSSMPHAISPPHWALTIGYVRVAKNPL
jgi:hypothetical protein